MEPIRFQRPELPASTAIERYLAEARKTRWFSNGGGCSRLLSERLAQFLGLDVSIVLVTNATLGLMVALRALVGEKPQGNLVVAPSFTFPATAQAIKWNGLQPSWADIEPNGWHLDPLALRRTLAEKGSDVAAVIACSTFGTAPSSAQLAAWREVCAGAGVPLLVDSAAGFGSRDESGGFLGAQGDAEVFSFHATKPFAIGEGGAVSTADPQFAHQVTAMANFGFNDDRQIASGVGLNAKMSEMHSAIGLAVLDNFQEVLDARRLRAEWLRSGLEPGGYVFQAGAEWSAWQFVPVVAPTARVRDAVLRSARDQKIEVRSYHAPLHLVPAFGTHPGKEAALPVTEDVASRSLSLPMANDLSATEVRRILSVLLTCADLPSSQAEEVRA